MFLLDTNVLLEASNTYYRIDMVPEYWDWLRYLADQGQVRICDEVFDEIQYGDISEWFKKDGAKEAFRLDEAIDMKLFNHVLDKGYGFEDGPTDVQLIKVGMDPAIVSYALAGENRTIVTQEVSASKNAHPQNMKIPAVCENLGISWVNSHTFAWKLGFSTGWRG